MADLDERAQRLIENWRDYRDHECAHGGPLPHMQALSFIAGVHVGSLSALVESGADDHTIADRARSFLAAWTAATEEQNAEWEARGLGLGRATTADEAGEVDGL